MRPNAVPLATALCLSIASSCGGPDAGTPCRPRSSYPDRDGDGHGDPSAHRFDCSPPEGFSPLPDDCDDARADAHPGAPEIVGDGRDEDCDGSERCYEDRDLDGRRSEAVVPSEDPSCDGAGEASVGEPLDCDDLDPEMGDVETCGDGGDDDCDGLVDFADPDCGGPEAEVREDGTVTLGGEPFFPLGVVFGWYGERGIDWDRTFRELTDAGANFLMHIDDGASDICGGLLPGAREAGIKVGIGSIETWFWNLLDEAGDCAVPIDPPVYSDAFLESVLSCARYDPNFVAWFNRDEPIWNYHPTCAPSRHMISEADVEEAWRTLDAQEPRRLVWINYATANRQRSRDAYVRDTSRYAAYADVLGFDLYPYPYHRPGTFGYERCVEPPPAERADWCWEHVVDDPEPTVTGEVARLHVSQIGGGKPYWVILQGYRDMPPADSLFMAYEAIVGGVGGIVFAGHQWDPGGPATWQSATKPTIRELSSLGPALVAPQVALDLGDTPGVAYLVKDLGDRLAILAVNRSPSPVEAVFDLDAAGPAEDSVDVRFEDRRVAIEGGIFRDDFAPYSRHVYEVLVRDER